MAKKPANHGKGWSASGVKQLKQLDKENTPTRVMGLKLDRTPGAVQHKASQEGISLTPVNQSLYNRRKK
jgi:hypothetical protein